MHLEESLRSSRISLNLLLRIVSYSNTYRAEYCSRADRTPWITLSLCSRPFLRVADSVTAIPRPRPEGEGKEAHGRKEAGVSGC